MCAGAHEAECVYSIWNTKEEAERLNNGEESLSCYDGKAYVKPVYMNEKRNEWNKYMEYYNEC